jgi:asparagine N-glycosylation enzyme membrane subunit Stt3
MTRRGIVSHHHARKLTDASPHPPKLWVAIVFAAAAVAVRCWPTVAKDPDSYLYLSLAANLAQNFCYSWSTAATHLCIPTWGYQPPGYPLFIAITQWLTFPNDRVVVVSQTVIFAGAAIYFARWLFASHRSPFCFTCRSSSHCFLQLQLVGREQL